ncbi:NAD-dependent epimerase/dehydratase family protein [Methylicorpusculum sp.]|uniref:NAD-dependent epimerase/dehydratase family protein n=1 Tax=Methylicorpusculum sp. TaxID=2713644 RepID=UPI00271E9659|nr:NAD-dependent epimerase/dehydratase family protein [Methylicorpusculum sp.]MDO8845435.1 NAD-dependent epimerase/dehydratase family protein [Methylicorpusculum sp.]
MSAGISLVTGATGHLGANLVRRLLEEGEQVRVMMRAERDNGALDGLNVERVFADLRDGEAVSNALRGCARVYHCAALVSTIEGNAVHKREIFETNVKGTIHILQAAERHGIDKVVVSGSLSATGYEPDRSSHEDMPFYPFDRHLPYGFTKHLTEHECLKAHANGLNVVVATSCAIIGPHDYVPSRMGRVLIDYAHGNLRAYIPGGFEFVSSRDIAEGHLLAMRQGRSGQKYIFSTSYASVDDLMEMFREVTGRPLPGLKLSPYLMAMLAQVADKTWYKVFPNLPRRFTPGAVRLLQMRRRAGHEKAKQELGYQPTQLSQAVQEAYDDFVRRGLIVTAR